MKKQLKLAVLVFTLVMSVVFCLSCGLTRPRPGGSSQSGGKDSTGYGDSNSGSYSGDYSGDGSEDFSGDTSDGEQSGHRHVWQKIVGKEYIAKKADCQHIGEYYYSCSCGEKSEKTFAFGDYGSHVIITEDSKDATCVESGYIGKQYCEVCGTVFREKTELLPLGHNYVGGICTRCGAKDAQHEHTPVVTEEKAATCTENGYRVYRCADSGDFIEKIILLATGHNYDSTVVHELSCTEDGEIRYTCANCSDTYIIITHGEHGYYISDRVSATCTSKGYVEYTCGNCGDVYRDEIPAGKHNYTFTIVKNPTTTETGIRRYTCSKCNDTYDEIIPKKAEVTGDRVLLIQDVLPWTERANNTVLTELVETGVISGYDVATTSALGEYDFYDYCVVVIANDQPSSSYSRLAGYKSALNAYVENGGVVVYGACDQGWESGDVSSALIGGIGKGGNYYSNYNYIVNNTHPIITGELSDGVSLTDELLYSTYASHTWFENLPDGSTVILQDGNGKPTLVEFAYGTGSVIATGLTWEYTYVRNFVKGTSFAKSVFDDMIIYAVSLSGEKCEHKYVSEVVPSTCVEKGYTLYTCTICGRKRKANFTPATGHAAVETVIREATCTSEGLARITCEKCDYSEEKILPKLSHVYELKASKEPTCTENGYNEYVCKVCGTVTGRYTVFATGHSYSSEVIQSLSCETDGIIRYTCKACGDSYDVVTKGEHSYRITARVAATCTSEGYVEYTCSKCDSSYRETIPVGAHSYTYKIVKRPTEVTTGIRRYTCTLCGDTYDEIIPVKVTGDSVLLVQDILPWTTSSNTSLLSSLVADGTIAGYDVVTSAMLADLDFEDYCIVIIANDQPSSTYSALAGCAAKLTSYAENGGVVVYGACDQGWVNGDVSSALIGGIRKGGNYYSNYNYIVDSEHPVVNGSLTDGKGLTNELLYGTYASHTWFKNLPEGSNIILQDGHGNPTLVEFSLGSGTVIATGLTWEFYYIRDMVGSTSFSKNVFDDMIIYALSLTGDACMHHYVLTGSYSASCNKNGYKVYTCELCGKERKADFVPAIGYHTLCGEPFDENKTYVYEGEIASVVRLFANVPHNCVEKSFGSFKCERCGETILISVTAPHEITYHEGKAATCTEPGYAAYESCANCDYTTYEEIPALGHNLSYHNGKAATCLEGGYEAYETCSRCGYTSYREIPALGHDITYHEGKEATCTSAGYNDYETCSRCDYNTYEEIPSLGHNFVNGKCTRCGMSDGSGDVGSDETYTRDGNYIYFGLYPQTKVTDSSLILSLNTMAGTLPTSSNSYSWTSYGYYIEGSVQNYMWYIDGKYNNVKYRGVYFTSYRPYLCIDSSSADNSLQDDNGYGLSTVYWFKYEPVKWRILTEQSGKAFLMCDMAIDSQQYYHSYNETRTIDGKTVYPNNYAESEIRKWLNETFYNTAFNSLQKSLVQTTVVDNSARSTNPYSNATLWNGGNNDFVCENTSDKVFLLSEYEVTNPAYGFNSTAGTVDVARQLKSSDYAKSQGCNQNTSSSYLGNCGRWWLRSPYYDRNSFAWRVDSYGYSNSTNIGGVYYSGSGVVPALWLDISGTTGGSGDVGGDETYTRDGNYIYFGSYPQTKVEDDSLISSLNAMAGTLPTSSDSYNWTSYGYYIDGSVQNYMWYIDEKYDNVKYRGVYFTLYRPYFCTHSSSARNSMQDDNGYKLSTIYWFKYESVKWKILTEKNGKAFLMCDMAIDAQQYYHNYEETRIINGKTIYANNYAESEIRRWLNEAFYNTAFNSLQKSLIQTTIVDNSARSTNPYNNVTYWNNGGNEYACENTRDKVFLFSEYDVTNLAYGFNSTAETEDATRQLKSSDYAKSQGCWQYSGSGVYQENCWWWLRSPHYDNNTLAMSIDSDGYFHKYGSVHVTSYGVVPALWIAL